MELEKEFNSAMNESEFISEHNLFALLLNMNLTIDCKWKSLSLEALIKGYLKKLKPDYV